MHSQNAAWVQMTTVKLNGFRSKQVDRDGVPGERIQHQNVVVLWRFSRQREARIAWNDLNLRFGFPDIAEYVTGDRHNLGIDIVELDIRFTKDRKMVLMHNKTIDGTTNGKGLVTDYTFEEIRKFRLKHKNVVTEEVIPTLEEALLAAKGKILIDLDIKQDECIDSIMVVVKRTGTQKNCLFFVYEPALAKMIKGKKAGFQLLVRTENVQAVDTLFSVVRPEAVHIDPSHYTESVVHTLKKGKSRVWINALGGVDKKAESGNLNAYDDLIKFGANIIQTDQPALVKKYLESKGMYYKKG